MVGYSKYRQFFFRINCYSVYRPLGGNCVLFLDKNVENYKGEKLILSLGYDNRVDDVSGKVLETALVFKIWNFMSLGGKFLFFIFIFLRL